MSKPKPEREGRIIIRGFDRTDDFRIICEKCGRDFGGTVGAREGHKVHTITCESCKYDTFETFMAEYSKRLADAS